VSLPPFSLWALKRRLQGWAGSPTWRSARLTTKTELETLLAVAGAVPAAGRYALYLPSIDHPAVTSRAPQAPFVVTDDDHLQATCLYVLANPVGVGLYDRVEDEWPWEEVSARPSR